MSPTAAWHGDSALSAPRAHRSHSTSSCYGVPFLPALVAGGLGIAVERLESFPRGPHERACPRSSAGCSPSWPRRARRSPRPSWTQLLETRDLALVLWQLRVPRHAPWAAPRRSSQLAARGRRLSNAVLVTLWPNRAHLALPLEPRSARLVAHVDPDIFSVFAATSVFSSVLLFALAHLLWCTALTSLFPVSKSARASGHRDHAGDEVAGAVTVQRRRYWRIHQHPEAFFSAEYASFLAVCRRSVSAFFTYKSGNPAPVLIASSSRRRRARGTRCLRRAAPLRFGADGRSRLRRPASCSLCGVAPSAFSAVQFASVADPSLLTWRGRFVRRARPRAPAHVGTPGRQLPHRTDLCARATVSARAGTLPRRRTHGRLRCASLLRPSHSLGPGRPAEASCSSSPPKSRQPAGRSTRRLGTFLPSAWNERADIDFAEPSVLETRPRSPASALRALLHGHRAHRAVRATQRRAGNGALLTAQSALPKHGTALQVPNDRPAVQHDAAALEPHLSRDRASERFGVIALRQSERRESSFHAGGQATGCNRPRATRTFARLDSFVDGDFSRSRRLGTGTSPILRKQRWRRPKRTQRAPGRRVLCRLGNSGPTPTKGLITSSAARSGSARQRSPAGAQALGRRHATGRACANCQSGTGPLAAPAPRPAPPRPSLQPRPPPPAPAQPLRSLPSPPGQQPRNSQQAKDSEARVRGASSGLRRRAQADERHVRVLREARAQPARDRSRSCAAASQGRKVDLDVVIKDGKAILKPKLDLAGSCAEPAGRVGSAEYEARLLSRSGRSKVDRPRPTSESPKDARRGSRSLRLENRTRAATSSAHTAQSPSQLLDPHPPTPPSRGR